VLGVVGISSTEWLQTSLVWGRPFQAHRIAWTLAHGEPIPPGLCVMYTCDNRACCNPDHLKLGTHDENMADMACKGRSVKGEKHWSTYLSAEEVLQIRELYRSGVSTSRLADEFGVVQGTIWNIVTGKTWPHCKGPIGTRAREERRGEGHPNAKLTGNTVVQIRKKYHAGVAVQELANKYSVSEFTIYDIVKGCTWAHVGSPIGLRGKVKREG